jgi:hypothetical protein
MKRSTNDSQGRTKTKKQQTLKEKIHKHISDKNDVITDQDIRDVKIEDINEVPLRQEEEIEKKEEEIQPNDENRKANTWDVLSEGYD